ncbi:anaerobic glycerol-3-phosphate dehydrogenase subunit C [Tepidibacillus fermentans]|uniref:Glycerol 3-phosphate dehydrogenase (Quinone) subunit C n=1 Tax=Tepidibacillus fermentans TaxID=1281767 RepID=A0A4R3KI61_9BACI|nr:anaerobic glycerol-3-phosphate dehydrogenase subunit C [Tepidibacillus fermentans]TCS83187.1 glycerol 3-phosphate dehydrogenase (quinone) subunit C [Tepidibacillus fermentans]
MINLPDTSYDQCLKCNACVVSCPVSNATLDFGGPKHLGPELKRLMENQELIDDPRIELCTLCGNCDLSCPEDVHVSSLTAQAKAIHAEISGTKFRDKILSQAEIMGKVASTFAPITNTVMKMKPLRKAMQKIMGIHADRKFPEYQFKNFNRTYKKKTANTKRKVAYFVGCYATYNAPQVAEAFVEVMSYNGIEVAKPDQHCCGIPMLANGQIEQAMKNAKFNVKSLLEYTRKGYDIVLTCTSCTTALKKEYPEVLKIEGAKELAEHVFDADEYLRMLHEEGEMNTNLAPMSVKAGYYAPCHMKAQGIGNPAMDVLELIPGYEIQDLAAGCCGQCGTFGFKEEKFEISLKMGAPMKQAVEELDAEYTVTECGMCKTQLDQLTDKPVKHPMEIMAEAYRKAVVY